MHGMQWNILIQFKDHFERPALSRKQQPNPSKTVMVFPVSGRQYVICHHRIIFVSVFYIHSELKYTLGGTNLSLLFTVHTMI